MEGITPEHPDFERSVSERVYSVARELENQVGGFDFAHVVMVYHRACEADDEE